MDDYCEYESSYATASFEEIDRQKRFERLPDICKSCRWLDWYYEDAYAGNIPCANLAEPWHRANVEQRVMDAPPLKACHLTEKWACPLWARDLGVFGPHWLWLAAIQVQAFLWDLRLGFRAWEIRKRQMARYEYLEYLLNSHRAGKLLRKYKTFIVVVVDETYFATVYGMIRGVELAKGRWTEEDELAMIRALDEWQEVCPHAAEPARASVKAGWRLAPETCPECGAVMRPVAHDTGEGWWLGYECGSCGDCTVADEGIIDWPFVEERARAADLEAIGFTVV